MLRQSAFSAMSVHVLPCESGTVVLGYSVLACAVSLFAMWPASSDGWFQSISGSKHWQRLDNPLVHLGSWQACFAVPWQSMRISSSDIAWFWPSWFLPTCWRSVQLGLCLLVAGAVLVEPGSVPGLHKDDFENFRSAALSVEENSIP